MGTDTASNYAGRDRIFFADVRTGFLRIFGRFGRRFLIFVNREPLFPLTASGRIDFAKPSCGFGGNPSVGIRRGRKCNEKEKTMARSLGWMMLLMMAATAMAARVPIARASVNQDSISIAFGRDEPPTTPGCFLAPTDIAGVYHFRSPNWNNEVGNVGTTSNLVRDTNGVASTTTAVLSWTADNTWSTVPGGTRIESNNFFVGTDRALMTGYLDNANANATVISVKNLPADLAAGYWLVIYSLGGVLDRPAEFFVNDPAKANPKYIIPGGITPIPNHSYSGPDYIAAIGDDPQLGATGSMDDYGNYLIFYHLSGDLTIIAQPLASPNGVNRVPVNAIQIIKSP